MLTTANHVEQHIEMNLKRLLISGQSAINRISFGHTDGVGEGVFLQLR